MAIQLSSKNLSIVFLDTDLDACFLFQVREVFSCYVFKYVLSPFLSLSPLSGTFFFPFIFISWRLITLQYCSGFCHTLTWISHGVTCVPHPDPPSHIPPHPIPLGLPIVPAPLYQPWALVSCIQPGLEICFTLDSILVSMLFSQNIPPLPFPSPKVCSVKQTVLSLFLFCI